jgi:hypothetical protein
MSNKPSYFVNREIYETYQRWLTSLRGPVMLSQEVEFEIPASLTYSDSYARAAEFWRVIPEKTDESWLELRDPDGFYKAGVKWDGCVHFDRYYNAPLDDETRRPEDRDYIHICDVEREIERLQALLVEARKHFGEHWPL